MIGERESPHMFNSLDDAQTVARLLNEVVWGAIYGQQRFQYRVYPGGRTEQYQWNKGIKLIQLAHENPAAIRQNPEAEKEKKA